MAQAADGLVYRCTICHAVYTAGERFCPLDAGAIAPDGDTDPRVGRTIDGRYFVRRLIGRGGMGAVYEADHVGLDKRVAIKFLAINKTDRDALARFRREAKTASRIVHEHVVQIYDVGTADADTDFIVMELIDGQDLAAVLRESRMLEPGRTIAIARQVLSGLSAIHEAGIVHRDIKPANILLATRRGGADFVKIMDFGISRPVHGETITSTGAIIGTPEYMAPEQLLADDIDQRADLYAVGVMLYRMLTGTLPFTSEVFDRAAAASPYVEVPSVRTLRPDVPVALAEAIARAVAKDADHRHADAHAFLAALEPVAGLASSAAAPPTVDQRGRSGPSTGGVSGLERTVSAIGNERTVSALEGADTAMVSSEMSRSAVTAPAKRTDGAVPVPPAVTIPETTPRRRSRAPLFAGLGLLVAGVAVAAFVVINGDRGGGTEALPAPPTPPTAPAGGPPPSASPAAESQAKVLLRKAREAEAAGKIDDAIAAYTEAYAIEPAADTIFQIAELHERAGHPEDAVAAFQRYLHVAKDASDHDVVVARIAKLEKAAGAASSPTPPTPPTAPRRTVVEELEECHCIPSNGPDTQSLCAKKGPSLCMCKHERGVKLCPTQVTRCAACPDPDQRCDEKGCTSAGFECSDKQYEAFHVRGVHGTKCTGFEDYRLGPELEGALYCDVCSDAKKPRQFRGHHGDKCVGYYRHTGEKMEGRLWCHRD